MLAACENYEGANQADTIRVKVWLAEDDSVVYEIWKGLDDDSSTMVLKLLEAIIKIHKVWKKNLHV